VQRPVLDQLEAAWHGRLQVLEIDATLRPELADAWGVLAVPTTFLTDSGGRPRRVNHGVARLEKLMAQLAEIGEALPESSPVHDLAREEQRR
jgi:thioredoxin-like negative regulator of GroEL